MTADDGIKAFNEDPEWANLQTDRKLRAANNRIDRAVARVVGEVLSRNDALKRRNGKLNSKNRRLRATISEQQKTIDNLRAGRDLLEREVERNVINLELYDWETGEK